MSQKALTEHAGIEQPTMAATLVRMERDGAIERQSDPGDKRSVLSTLSAQTRSRASEIEAAIRHLNSDALDGVSRSDRERLHDVLAAIAMSVEKQLRQSPRALIGVRPLIASRGA